MVNGEISRDTLIKYLYEAIKTEELAAFLGAGLSIQAGFKSWKEMLKEPADEISLDVDREEHDLVSLAQFYCNSRGRTNVDNLITENFASLTSPTINHNLLAQLPITTFWTTNYDKLIEKALENNNKLPNVKTRDEHLRGTNRPFDAIVYKMHGDVTYPSSAVITRSDYENYGFDDRKLFREVLEGDLLTKTFLFLGFSFSDPNFNYVIARLRVLLEGKGTRSHYCIMKREKSLGDEKSYAQIKQELQIQDLKRYGIYTCLIDDYSEITEILNSLVNKYRRKTIFISGSAFNYDPFSPEEGKKIITELSYSLAEKGYHVVNGYGLGVGTYVINGVAKYCYSDNKKEIKEINDILTLMPFPLDSEPGESIRDFYSKYREIMIRRCGISIYLFGNKENGDVAEGVIEEYEISEKLGLVSLPIKATGGASSKIYNNIITKKDIPTKYLEAIELVGQDFDNIEDIVKSTIKAVNLLNEEE